MKAKKTEERAKKTNTAQKDEKALSKKKKLRLTTRATIKKDLDFRGHKRAEETRMESESRYRIVFEMANDAIFMMDQNIFIDCNAKTLEIFDCTQEQIIGQTPYRFSPDVQPDGRNSMEKAQEKINAALTGQPQFFEWQHSRYDGTLFDAEVSLNAVSTAGKYYLLSIVRNITHHKRAEETLRESEKRLRETQEMARLGHWHWDVKTGDVKWSDEIYRIFKLDPEKFTPHIDSILALSPWPEDHERDQELIRRAMETHEKGTYEQRFLRPDGSIGYYHSTFQGNYDEGGKLISIIGTVLDITERKRAEEERLLHFRFMESLDKVTRAIQGTNDLNQMMNDALETVLSIFDCDRTWLFYPCDPDAPSFRVPMEIAKPEYPGAKVLNVDVSIPPDMAQNLREALESAGPVTYIVGTERPINKVSTEQFGVKSMMMVALYPKLGKPWAFGLHQCSTSRIWTKEEIKLFKEISCRISDGLSSLLFLHDLQESEERFRRLAENARDVIYRMSLPDGKYEYISPAVLSVFGYSPEEFYKTPVLIKKLIHPDWQKYFEEQWANLIKGEMPPTYEYQFIHKSGEVRWLNQRNISVRDNAGNPIAIEGIVTDITERKRAEDALRKSESFINNIVENIPDMIFVKDAMELRFVRFNKAGEELLGYSSEELIGKNDYDFFTKDEAALFTLKDREVLHSKKLLDISEENIQTRHNGTRILHTKKIPIFDNEGNPQYLLGISEDITERKRAEEALRQSEEKFRILMESSPTAIMLYQYNKWVYANPASTEITGYTEQELRSMNFWDIVHPDDKQQVHERGQKRQRGEAVPNRYIFRIISKDGAVKWVDLSGATVVIGGSPAGIISVLDITERKRAEEEIRILNQELEQRVADRTSRLESANKELEAFSYSVSHDLRAPLRAIDGFSRIVLEEYASKLDDEGRRLLDVISANTAKMGQLIDDLLAFSRLSRQKMASAPVNL
ncbi:MAG TPA: PAS domain S-box protein, partial [Syntrophales bacterium]